MLFADRADAGRRLAVALRALAGQDVVVVGLPPGGVAVGFEVARTLRAPLDVVVVPRFYVPGFDVPLRAGPGAGGERRVLVTSADIIGLAAISEQALGSIERSDRAELDRQARRFRGHRAAVPLAGRTVIVVDEGVTIGSTARAACWIVRAQGAARTVLATPVGPYGIQQRMAPHTDLVVCLHTPTAFFTLGECYPDPVPTDSEVAALLRRASWDRTAGSDPDPGPTADPADHPAPGR
jgi:putative phosphoribosyl transferase